MVNANCLRNTHRYFRSCFMLPSVAYKYICSILCYATTAPSNRHATVDRPTRDHLGLADMKPLVLSNHLQHSETSRIAETPLECISHANHGDKQQAANGHPMNNYHTHIPYTCVRQS